MTEPTTLLPRPDDTALRGIVLVLHYHAARSGLTPRDAALLYALERYLEG